MLTAVQVREIAASHYIYASGLQPESGLNDLIDRIAATLSAYEWTWRLCPHALSRLAKC